MPRRPPAHTRLTHRRKKPATPMEEWRAKDVRLGQWKPYRTNILPQNINAVNRKNAHRLTRAMSVPLQNGGKDGMRRRPANIFISVAAPLVPLVGSVHSRLAIATTRPAQPFRPDRATRQEHIPGEGPTAFSCLLGVMPRIHNLYPAVRCFAAGATQRSRTFSDFHPASV